MARISKLGFLTSKELSYTGTTRRRMKGKEFKDLNKTNNGVSKIEFCRWIPERERERERERIMYKFTLN